ncbi:hypothetical protein ACWEDF_20560 [Micromonospora chersina]
MTIIVVPAVARSRNVSPREKVVFQVRVWVDASVRDGDYDALAVVDLLSFLNLQEGEVPLILPDSPAIISCRRRCR